MAQHLIVSSKEKVFAMSKHCEVKRQKASARTLRSLMTAAAIVIVSATAAVPNDRSAAEAQAKMPILLIGGKEDPDVYLQSLDIQVEVTGNIASTRYTMVFKNKTNRMLEGELTFPLPDGRTATHYALDINGKMREAVPVEKARATQVFEEIQQRQVDPGILERVEGNNFRTRIYPFPRNGTRTISIGYEEELSLEDGLLYYRLPMAYAAPLEKFSVKATVWKNSVKPIVPISETEIRFDRAGENYVAAFTRTNYRPARALVFALPAPSEIPQVLMQRAQGSHYFLASVTPNAETRKKQWNDDLAIIWDVSLSGTRRDLKREMEMLGIIFAEKRNANVHLYFLNNKLKKIADRNTGGGEFKIVNGRWDALKSVLQGAIFDGGTDFSQVKLHNITGKEILFFSDGLSTLSDPDFVKDIRDDRPIHCVVSSSNADYSAMKLIAGKTMGKFVNLNALSAEKLKDELLNETLQFLGTEHGSSVREVYPGIATPVYGNFSVAGIAAGNNAEITLLFGYGNKVEKRIKVRLNAANATSRGNVHKIWAQKKIAELDLDYETNREELTELGKQFGIVTRNTSLIVLEFIDDYIQFNIDPPPELRAEYQSRLAWFNERRRSTERSLLEDAANAAYNIGNWWGIDHTPKQPKYPVPDNDESARAAPPRQHPQRPERFANAVVAGTEATRTEEIVQRSSVAVQGTTNTKATASPSTETKAAPSTQATSSASTAEPKAAPPTQSSQTQVKTAAEMPPPTRPKSSSSSGDKRSSSNKINRAVAFDAAEVIGYLDNPSPTYIIDMEDPNADPIALDRSFRDAIRTNFGRYDPITHFLTVNMSPSHHSGSISVTPDPGHFFGGYSRNTPVTVTAKAKPGYRFDGWFGAPQGVNPSDSSISFNINSDVRLTANFRKYNYLDTLTGNLATDYRMYLKLRNSHANSPSFYFDMAHWFYTRGDRATALRILTCIAELGLEDASLYKMLGYRLKEYGEHTLQKFVFGKVVKWRPIEPQSYRDYALALADAGEPQAALDSLYSLLTRRYSTNIANRSRGLDEVVVTEINRLIARYPDLNTSKIDNRLITNIPVDIRVVLNWNMDNIDIDLMVIDPNGEQPYNHGWGWGSGNRTRIGGRMNLNNRNGYGPEQFMLKDAIGGKYQIIATYRRAQEFASTAPITVMAEIYTKYAGKTEVRRIVCLQLTQYTRWDGERALMAELEIER